MRRAGAVQVVALVLVGLAAGPLGGCNCGSTEAPDAGVPDAGVPDAGVPDAGQPDAGQPDAGLCVKPANRALHFSGAQYLQVPDSASLHVSDMTIEAWVSFSAIPTFGTVVGKPLGTGTQDSFALWYEVGGLHAGAAPSNPATAIGLTWTPVLGRWYHLAFVYAQASRAQQLYIDGVLVASGTAPADPTYDTHPFLIGGDLNYGTFSGFFSGDIDEVRIWVSTRTVDEIGQDLRTCVPGTVAGLAAYFPLDEGAGQTALDQSGNGNDAILGATTGVEASDPTWVDSGVVFPP
jgi:Concanavalin A-like lectin/glucanases superfamily